jgi:hypothetical protein
MGTNVFISFNHEEKEQLESFHRLKSVIPLPLDSFGLPSQNGQPARHPPHDERSKPQREEIMKKLKKASKFVVLIGARTFADKWVDWEIKAFIELKSHGRNRDIWRCIRGMRLEGHGKAKTPEALQNRSTESINWLPEKLHQWLKEA